MLLLFTAVQILISLVISMPIFLYEIATEKFPFGYQCIFIFNLLITLGMLLRIKRINIRQNTFVQQIMIKKI